jgi:hypothetical protein
VIGAVVSLIVVMVLVELVRRPAETALPEAELPAPVAA